ncbi:hypothetical protein N7478_006934 [Penicillium angulare]|uniref:uncharacterized protein n=1 Tax=Penicillium angulare TaxID=116970 RepID=UPI00254031DB|nr:uncharacterized protein N7478_006934 [Penicillium angulare]KAJ5281562.1 hypothetical protein N7478_006934 [Penicillium angulare]
MSLQNLPTELLDQICSHLETRDLNSLRLTCEELLQEFQKFYGDHHHGTIYMIVTSDALRQLQQIAYHEIFRTCVKKLIILPILFDDHKRLSEARLLAEFSARISCRPEERDDLLRNLYEVHEAIITDHELALNSL